MFIRRCYGLVLILWLVYFGSVFPIIGEFYVVIKRGKLYWMCVNVDIISFVYGVLKVTCYLCMSRRFCWFWMHIMDVRRVFEC